MAGNGTAVMTSITAAPWEYPPSTILVSGQLATVPWMWALASLAPSAAARKSSVAGWLTAYTPTDLPPTWLRSELTNDSPTRPMPTGSPVPRANTTSMSEQGACADGTGIRVGAMAGAINITPAASTIAAAEAIQRALRDNRIPEPCRGARPPRSLLTGRMLAVRGGWTPLCERRAGQRRLPAVGSSTAPPSDLTVPGRPATKITSHRTNASRTRRLDPALRAARRSAPAARGEVFDGSTVRPRRRREDGGGLALAGRGHGQQTHRHRPRP